MIDHNTHFLIVGLGLIGGSYARILKKAGCPVDGLDIDADTIEYGLQQGIIDRGSTAVDAQLISEADVIVFGLYPKQEVAWIRQHQHLLKAGTLLTDVSGVKGGVLDEIQSFLRADVEIIGCHPMAGREVNGIRNSLDSMFRKANFIVVATEKNSPQAIGAAYQLGNLLGCEKISTLTIAQHDELVGFVSQLTHVIAVALMTCNDDENLQDYTGDSFRDLTRIARINENMWSELFIANKAELIAQIDAFSQQMQRLRELIADEDEEGLKEVLRASTARRALFDK